MYILTRLNVVQCTVVNNNGTCSYNQLHLHILGCSNYRVHVLILDLHVVKVGNAWLHMVTQGYSRLHMVT